MTTSDCYRRDPLKGKNGFSAHKGFTIIELMIAIGVLAIVTSLALPSYRAIIEKRQVTSGAEQAAAFFSTVKGQAVKRNNDIAMYPASSDDEWCLGFKEFDSALTFGQQDCDCMVTDHASADACAVDLDNNGTIEATEMTVLRSSELRKPEVLKDINTFEDGSEVSSQFFVFDSVRGFIDTQSGYADSLQISLESGQYVLDVWIDQLGRTYICSPQSDDHIPVPGYDPC